VEIYNGSEALLLYERSWASSLLFNFLIREKEEEGEEEEEVGKVGPSSRFSIETMNLFPVSCHFFIALVADVVVVIYCRLREWHVGESHKRRAQ